MTVGKARRMGDQDSCLAEPIDDSEHLHRVDRQSTIGFLGGLCDLLCVPRAIEQACNEILLGSDSKEAIVGSLHRVPGTLAIGVKRDREIGQQLWQRSGLHRYVFLYQ